MDACCVILHSLPYRWSPPSTGVYRRQRCTESIIKYCTTWLLFTHTVRSVCSFTVLCYCFFLNPFTWLKLLMTEMSGLISLLFKLIRSFYCGFHFILQLLKRNDIFWFHFTWVCTFHFSKSVFLDVNHTVASRSFLTTLLSFISGRSWLSCFTLCH